MKLVILFYLFLAISYYIFLQRKKIVEGHSDSPQVKSAAKSSELKNISDELDNKKADVRKLLNEVKALIEEEKGLREGIKRLEDDEEGEEGGGGGGESSICEMTDCKTVKSNRNCSQFKIDSGIDCQ